MLAVYKRDLRAYFTSPLGYVFIAAFLIVTNLVFLLTNLLTGSNAIARITPLSSISSSLSFPSLP